LRQLILDLLHSIAATLPAVFAVILPRHAGRVSVPPRAARPVRARRARALRPSGLPRSPG
jgi:hypothetical protein